MNCSPPLKPLPVSASQFWVLSHIANRSQVAFDSGEFDGAATAVPVMASGAVTAAAATPARITVRQWEMGWRWRPDIRDSGSSRGPVAGNGEPTGWRDRNRTETFSDQP